MSRVLSRFAQTRTAYLPLGLAVSGIAALSLLAGTGGRLLVKSSPDAVFAYAMATGGILTLSMLWQWRLYFARRSMNAPKVQREYKLHRWAGLVPVGLLAAHIGGPGGSLLSVMSYCLLVSSLSGIFNNEIVRQKNRVIRKVWLVTHVGFATFIIPIILLHVWTVFAFKGP